MGKAGRGAEKRREPSFESGAGTLDVRLAPEDRATPATDAVQARRSTKTPSAKSSKSSSAKSGSARRVEPKVDPPGRSRPPAPPKKGKSARRGGRRSGLFRLVYWGAVLSIWAGLGVVGLFAWVAMHLPPIQSLEIPKRPPAVQINSLDAKVFANRGEMGGAALALKEMPAHLPNAFIAIEDRRFRSHHGVDPVGLFRAVVANLLRRGISQGGSTITQQLAKNLFLTPERHIDAQAAGGGAGAVARAQVHQERDSRALSQPGLFRRRRLRRRGRVAALFRQVGARRSRWPKRRCSPASSSRRRG